MTGERAYRFVAVTVCLVAVFSAPLWVPHFYVQLLINTLALGLTAMSFILLAGYAGMVSLAQLSFYCIAAYVIGIGTMDLGWPTLVLLPLAVVAAGGAPTFWWPVPRAF